MGFEETVYDAPASVPAAASCARDLVKKKRANRSAAKLKQCKLDARREQWLSQVKSKGMGSPPSMRVPIPLPQGRREEHGEGIGGGGLQDSDADSPACSPVSAISTRKDSPSSHSGSCYGSYSLTASDTEEDGGGLDDWEAVADALSADQEDQDDEQGSDSIVPAPDPPLEAHRMSFVEAVNPLHSDPSHSAALAAPRAWCPDDQFRPQSLPILSKQQSFPVQLERHRDPWGQRGILAAPSSCPICYEDLDPTDSRFLPCSCGFRLCLFCHNRILEDDGRCPGCRKKYMPAEAGINGGEPRIPLRLLRSCSITY